MASKPGSAEVASRTHSLCGQKGRVASEPGTGKVASGTRSLCAQKEKHVVLDTGEFVSYLGETNTEIISMYL